MWSGQGTPTAYGDGNQWNGFGVPDGLGGIYVSWLDDYGKGSVWEVDIQHLDKDGKITFDMSGKGVATANDSQFDPLLISDGATGAIMAWVENRYGKFQVKMQRFNISGNMLWGAEGLTAVDSSVYPKDMQIFSDGSGGAVLVWKNLFEKKWQIRAHRVGAQGQVLW